MNRSSGSICILHRRPSTRRPSSSVVVRLGPGVRGIRLIVHVRCTHGEFTFTFTSSAGTGTTSGKSLSAAKGVQAVEAVESFRNTVFSKSQ